MSAHDHGVCVVFVLVCGLANVALSMENNDSRLVSVPKQEFVRVMSEIASGSEAGINPREREESDMIYAVQYPNNERDRNA